MLSHKASSLALISPAANLWGRWKKAAVTDRNLEEWQSKKADKRKCLLTPSSMYVRNYAMGKLYLP